MQGAITKIADVKAWVEQNQTPYWRLFSGAIGSRESYPLMPQLTDADMASSLATLEKTLNFFNTGYGGTFNLLLSKDSNPKDNSGPRVNITLGTDTQTQNAPKMAGIGIGTLEELETRLEKERQAVRAELKKEYEQKAAIGKLQEQIEELKYDRGQDWTPERIGNIVEKVALHPITMLVLSKALGINGTELLRGIQGLPQQEGEHISDNPSSDDEKIDTALELFEAAQFSPDELLAVAQFAKSNPQMAKSLLTQISSPQNFAQG